MSLTLALPRMGETMEEGRVVVWIKKPGNAFRRGEILVEIETDKTIVEMPALVDGILQEIVATEGSLIKVGDPLCRYEGEASAESAQSESTLPAMPIVQATRIDWTKSTDPSPRTRATSKARAIARHEGIKLESIPGSGRRGRIEARDLTGSHNGRVVSGITAEPVGLPASSDRQPHYRALSMGRMAYREWSGSSAWPLVVALHGFGGDSQTWAMWASLLSRQERRILAPDLPGHGKTTVDAPSFDKLVDAITEFLAYLPEPTFELVGHSMGAAAAVHAALRLARRVERVTLIAPAGLGAEIDADFIYGLCEARAPEELARLLKRVAVRPPKLSTEQLRSMVDALNGGVRLRDLAGSILRDGAQHIRISGALGELEGRARLAWGLEDRIIPWRQAAGAGFGTPVHLIADAGHMPHWDQPSQLAKLFVLHS